MTTIEPIWLESIPYDPEFHKRLLRLCDPKKSKELTVEATVHGNDEAALQALPFIRWSLQPEVANKLLDDL